MTSPSKERPTTSPNLASEEGDIEDLQKEIASYFAEADKMPSTEEKKWPSSALDELDIIIRKEKANMDAKEDFAMNAIIRESLQPSDSSETISEGLKPLSEMNELDDENPSTSATLTSSTDHRAIEVGDKSVDYTKETLKEADNELDLMGELNALKQDDSGKSKLVKESRETYKDRESDDTDTTNPQILNYENNPNNAPLEMRTNEREINDRGLVSEELVRPVSSQFQENIDGKTTLSATDNSFDSTKKKKDDEDTKDLARLRILTGTLVVVINGVDDDDEEEECDEAVAPGEEVEAHPFDIVTECDDEMMEEEASASVDPCKEMTDQQIASETKRHEHYIAIMAKNVVYDDKTDQNKYSELKNEYEERLKAASLRNNLVCPIPIANHTFLKVTPNETIVLEGPFDNPIKVNLEITNVFNLPVSFQMINSLFPLEYTFSKQRGILTPGATAKVVIEFNSLVESSEDDLADFAPRFLAILGSVVSDLTADPEDFSLVLQKNSNIKFQIFNESEDAFRRMLEENQKLERYLITLRRIQTFTRIVIIGLFIMFIYLSLGVYLESRKKRGKYKRFFKRKKGNKRKQHRKKKH